MDLYEQLYSKKASISVVGLGYVGLPLAVAFAKEIEVIGYDINEAKVNKYKSGIDITKEVGNKELEKSTVVFTNDESDLKSAKFHIISVPTPVNTNKIPDLSPVIGASKTVGRNLTTGSIVVYESTVYPGVTEDICVPILEQESGLRYGIDFKVGYSPERINPGDKVHRLENIVKIVSGMDEESLELIAKTYELIIEAGVHRAESIKVAEAAKVIENSQRDINIAFMNELSMVFNKMGIDTKAVLEAAGTKWNFLNFSPGLVGGHCIGVDPYYFVYRAEELGYHSQIILSGRRINDEMGKYVAENTVKKLIQAGIKVKGAKVAIFGITFKENCPDSRNTKIIDIINELEDYGVELEIVDPIAEASDVFNEYGLKLSNIESVKNVDGIIIAVPHDTFSNIDLRYLKNLYRKDEMSYLYESNGVVDTNNEVAATVETGNDPQKVLIDVRGLFNKNHAEEEGFLYWRL
ncbi:nucleotide sugar dehydrogenase [Peribacillus simplex]